MIKLRRVIFVAVLLAIAGIIAYNTSTSRHSEENLLPDNGLVVLVSCLGCNTCANALVHESTRSLESGMAVYLAIHRSCAERIDVEQFAAHKRLIVLDHYDVFKQLAIETGNGIVVMKSGTSERIIPVSPVNLNQALKLLQTWIQDASRFAPVENALFQSLYAR